MMKKNESPDVPLSVTTVPAGVSTVREMSAIRRSSSSVQPLKSGTRRRCSTRASPKCPMCLAVVAASSEAWTGRMSGRDKGRMSSDLSISAPSGVSLPRVAVDPLEALAREPEHLVESAQLHTVDRGVVIGHGREQPGVFIDRRLDLLADEPPHAASDPPRARPARAHVTERDDHRARVVDGHEAMAEMVLHHALG